MLIILYATVVVALLTIQSTGPADAFARPDHVIHSQDWLTTFLHNISAVYPNIAHLYTIGKSVEGRDLWVLALGESPKDHIKLRPEVKLIGNIHGNEVVSRELLVQLIYHLVSGYGQNHTITRTLNTTRIHVLVSMNPDGFSVAEESGRGDCHGVSGRGNAYDFDLNRNFPDYFVNNQVEIQPETIAIMNWLNSLQFVLSATLHGGALLVNYPYDNLKKEASGYPKPSYSRTADDDVFVHLAKTYSYAHPTMHTGVRCPDDHYRFQHGIVNGASWYLVTGSMQDYNYIYAGCMELTLEVSCCKFPPDSEMESMWESNKEPLLQLLSQVHKGVKGLVLGPDKTPIVGAKVTVVGREHSVATTPMGEFWRILLPGHYSIKIEADGYHMFVRSFNLPPTEIDMQASSRTGGTRSSMVTYVDDVHTNVTILVITMEKIETIDMKNPTNAAHYNKSLGVPSWNSGHSLVLSCLILLLFHRSLER